MKNGKRKWLFYLVSLVLVLLVIEVGLQGINVLVNLFIKKQNPNPLLLYYQDAKMANEVWKETWDALKDHDYLQFLGWANQAYHGAYVNDDPQSGRKTWNVTAGSGQPHEKLFFLGGSAAWGLGARDEFTIPSYLSRLLNKQAPRIEVSNYGEPGYIFLQGIIHLTLLLREGQIPRYVIFYDGFNEIYAAHQHGLAGTVHNLFMTREKIKLRFREIIWNGITEAIRKYSMTYQSFDRLYLALNQKKRYQEVAVGYTDAQLRSLSRDIIEDYKKSIGLLDHLSKAYNFKYVCFWQPTMFTEVKLFGEEPNLDPRLADEAMKKLCVYTDEYLQQEKIPNLYMITSAFNNRTEPVYFDVAHLVEKGNELIANVIYQYLKKESFTNN